MTEQELLNAAANGSWKEIEYKYTSGWRTPENLQCFLNVLSMNVYEPCRWRRKQQPKMIPLGPEDVLYSTQFRCKSWSETQRRNYRYVSEAGIVWGVNAPQASWQELQQNWLRTDDSGKSWQRCEKEVKE